MKKTLDVRLAIIKKGDFIRTKKPFNGKIQNGYCIKTAKKGATIYAKIFGGGGCFGDVSSFEKLPESEIPRDTPNVMDKYTVKSYKEHETLDGYSFSCKVFCEGKKEPIFAQNDGNGGCNMYFCSDRDLERQFRDDAKTWCKEFNYPYDNECDDTFINWYQHERPRGIRFADSASEARKEWTELNNKMKDNLIYRVS